MESKKFLHNTYEGITITPQSLIEFSPIMPQTLTQKSDDCLNQYFSFINELVTRPEPLNHITRKEKTESNNKIIQSYEAQNEVKNLSSFNYVLHFTKFPEFTIPINRFGSYMACIIYANNLGSVLDANFDPNFDCSQLEQRTCYQHCSRVAHYLRLKEIIINNKFKHLKTTPTYLKHIPGKPEILSDENYVVIQEFIPGLKEITQLSADKRTEVLTNMPHQALKEFHDAIIYAALWGTPDILAIDEKTPHYYIIDLEEPFNHKPQLFYFQGAEGKKKYILDVIDGLERMAQSFSSIPIQLNHWKKLTQEHTDFIQLCKEFNVFPNYNTDHLNKKK